MNITLILIGVACTIMAYCIWRMDRLIRETLTWREILDEKGIEGAHNEQRGES